VATAKQAVDDHRAAFERLAVHEAIAAVWTLVRRANQYIEETAPWKLAKNPEDEGRLGSVMNALLESVRLAALLLTPVMPGKCAEIRGRLKAETGHLSMKQARWDPAAFRPAAPLERPDPLFPRIEAPEAAPEGT
jgi:methionyl-tRNA synthetase